MSMTQVVPVAVSRKQEYIRSREQGHLRRPLVVYLSVIVVENLDIESQIVNYVI